MNHEQHSQITLEILIEELLCNREVELTLEEVLYFIEPKSSCHDVQQFVVWEVSSHTRVFQGNLQDLLLYSFPNNKSLANHFSSFEILYIY